MRHSLRQKTVVMIIVIALLLSIVSIFVSIKAVSDIVRVNYEESSSSISRTVASVVDAEALGRLQASTKKIYDSIPPEERITSDDWGSDEFYEYLSHFEPLAETEDYKTVMSQLREIQNVNDVDCIYTCFVDQETEKFIYLVDAADEDACPIGCMDPIYEENRKVLTDLTVGFPTYTTDTEEYGYLATTGTPVYDKTGAVVGFAMVDIAMEDIASTRARMFSILVGFQILMIGLVVIFSVIVVNMSLVRPINKLSQAAQDYSDDDDVISHNNFAELDIHSHDEIETLSESMKQMEKDLNDKIFNLLRTTNELTESRQEVSKMSDLALKDALTGVRSKHAYNNDIHMLEQALAKAASAKAAGISDVNSVGAEDNITEFGVAVIDMNDLKKVNDSFGHEKGDIAIKEVCKIVCNVFVHSPVYRIGGDEFTVILKDHDLEHIDELISEFNSILSDIAENKDLQPWERVSASIGFVRYNADIDDTPESTFRRADRAMYLRKREMKGDRIR